MITADSDPVILTALNSDRSTWPGKPGITGWTVCADVSEFRAPGIRGGRPSGVILHGSCIARNVKGSVSGARPCLVQRAKMRPRIVEGAIDHACDQRHVANRVPV